MTIYLNGHLSQDCGIRDCASYNPYYVREIVVVVKSSVAKLGSASSDGVLANSNVSTRLNGGEKDASLRFRFTQRKCIYRALSLSELPFGFLIHYTTRDVELTFPSHASWA